MSLMGFFKRLLHIPERARDPLTSLPGWPGCGAEGDLRALIMLSRSNLKEEKVQTPESATILIRRCVAVSREVKSYHTQVIRTKEDEAIAWYADYEKPANVRVIQVMSTGEWDRWATIGNQHFEYLTTFLSGGQAQTKMAREWENAFIAIDKWLEVFESGHLVEAHGGVFKGRQLIHLEYQARSPNRTFPGLGPWAPENCLDMIQEIHLWIDEATGFLAKGVMRAQRASRPSPVIELLQVVGGYGHDMKFEMAGPFPELKSIAHS